MHQFTRPTLAVVFLPVLCVLMTTIGCGGGSGPQNRNENENVNGNANHNGNTNVNVNTNHNGNTNANTNANDNGNETILTVSIVGPAETTVLTNDQIDLSADVVPTADNLQYSWTVDPETAATFSDLTTTATTMTVTGQAASFVVTLSVTNPDTHASGHDGQNFEVTGNLPPPEGATLSILPVAPAHPGDTITLIPQFEGPAPVSVEWAQDPGDPISPIDFFVIEENHFATFTVPTFATSYAMTFIATANYDNGSTLTAEVSILVTLF